MADTKGNDKAREILDESDYEYEKKIYEEEKVRKQELEEKQRAAVEARKKRQKEAEKERERQLARERIALMKQKNGETDEEKAAETEEVEPETAPVMTKRKRIENFIYLNKWWLVLVGFVLFIALFIIIHQMQIKKADLTVMMIADNKLITKQEQLEKLFEEYVDDIDGNGYVHVSVVMIPLNPYSVSEDQKEYNSKFLANLYSTDTMLVITDSNTQYDYLEIMDHDLKSKFPGNKYVDEIGFSLNMKLIADKLDFEDMPYDIHLCIRQPVATVEDSAETAKKNYDKQFKYLEKMINDLTEKAEASNDPGLTTPPKTIKKAETEAESSQNS